MPENTDVLARLLPLIDRYLRDNDDPEVPVVRHADARALRERFDLSLPEQGCSLDELLPLIDAYLENSVRTGHRQFFNQLFGGFCMAGFLGDVVGSLSNTSMYTYEIAPLGTLMELELIERMVSLVGFPEGEGILCTGGSNANLLGVLCARDHAFPQLRVQGHAGSERPVLFVSDQAHYSFLKAANVLGIGTTGVVKVESDRQGRMDPRGLDRELGAAKSRGQTPFFVAATAGTTVLGAFDPLREIGEVCAGHGVWFHVDGAWGATALLSPRHRRLLDGCELADSMSWDAHKMMGASLTCAAFLARRRGALGRAVSTSESDADYLFHESDDGAPDLGRMSLQCGRKVDALKLWLMWKHFGDQGFAARVDRLFELAGFAAAVVEDHSRLELLAPRQSLSVCFRYRPPGVDDVQELNRVNRELRERLRRDGSSLINYAHLGPRLALRFVAANPETDESDVRRLFDHVIRVGADVARSAGVGAPLP